MSARNTVLACDGARAWLIDVRSGEILPGEEGAALGALAAGGEQVTAYTYDSRAAFR